MTHVSPSDYEWLASCPRHVAYAKERHPAGHRPPRSVPQRLGDAAHRTLDRLVREGSLADDGWTASFDAIWADEVAKEAAAAAADGMPGASAPESWADYQIKRAGTRRLANSIRELLLTHPGTEALPEEWVTAYGGGLVGRMDLVLRSDELHAVIDYKTGDISGTAGDPLKEQYRRQLCLYAALEREASGSWPTSTAIFPLRGQPVWVKVDQLASSTMASDALERLAAYNDGAPGPQPARVSAETCGRCSFVAACGDFWEAQPVGDILAVDGLVSQVFFAEQATVTLRVDTPNLCLEAQAVNPAYHPAVRDIVVGDRIRLVGASLIGDLSEAPAVTRCRLPPSGVLRVARTR